MVRANPDGYTIGYANVVTLAINKSLLSRQPYDPAKEKEAEGNGEAVVSSKEGWEFMAPESDRPSTLGKEIPVFSSKS